MLLEIKLDLLSLTFLIGLFFLVGFGFLLFHNYWYSHDCESVKLTAQDKYTVFLRKNWLWVIPLVSFGIGLLGALTITGSI